MIVEEDSLAKGHRYLLFLGGASEFDVPTIARIASQNPDLFKGKYSTEGTCSTLKLPELSLEQAKKHQVDRILIGVKSCCGQLSPDWQKVLIEALELGFDLVAFSPMNWSAFKNLSKKAKQTKRRLIEVKTTRRNFSIATGKPRKGNRLLTVGTDCAVGMTYTALAISEELGHRRLSNRFCSTGHASNFISDRAIDLSDIPGSQLSGAAEWLAPDSKGEHWDIIAGQASINHPSYAGMTLALLHGSQPSCLILCHKVGRKFTMSKNAPEAGWVRALMDIYLKLAQLTNPTAKFAGISVNTEALPEEGSRVYLEEIGRELELPATDPRRFGISNIVDHLIEISKKDHIRERKRPKKADSTL